MSEKEPQQTNDNIKPQDDQKPIESKADAWVKSWEAFDPAREKSVEEIEASIDEAKTESKEASSIESGAHAYSSHDDSLGVDSWLQSIHPYDPKRIKQETPDVDHQLIDPVVIDESKVRKRLTRWFFLLFIAFAIWAVYAPIDGGVTAQGTVVVSGYRKSVQHPTGGVVKEILVNDGDMVEEGQVLIKVNPLTLQANLGAIESEFINVLSNEARLKAERLGTKIVWPEVFKTIENQAQIKEAKATQEKLFNARREEYVDTMNARQAQLKSLIIEEKNLGQLAIEGLVPKASAEQAMRNRLESENVINTYKSTYIKQIETDLAEVQKRHEALQVQLEAARFDEAHTSIRSPATGKIIGLKVVTEGGVISGGQLLAEVVPQDAKLVIDVKLPPNVIDRVKVDAEVDLRFTAFNMNTTPVVPGRVLKVGSDRLLPDKTKPGEPDFEYYAAQVETTPKGTKMLGELNIQAGMPVDVIIKTGERSFLSWVMKPITDRLNLSFK
ncbi:MAG: HlyD family efflux transporter periplasmic adaptor subunit [Methylocystaceae bacterium]|nr:HlyD family efflux transporter periplasmic adaptor subunit [Methylocystaceae bacterium]